MFEVMESNQLASDPHGRDLIPLGTFNTYKQMLLQNTEYGNIHTMLFSLRN